MAGLPPPPLQDAQGSFGWLEWYRQLRDYLSSASSIPWAIINFAGSKITDIQQRRHNDLQNIQGGSAGEYYHLTAAQVAAIGAASSVITKTSSYVATASDGTILCDATSGTLTVTIPTAVGNSGSILSIKKIDSSGNGVVLSSGELIDGSATQTTIIQYVNITIQSDGSNWYIL